MAEQLSCNWKGASGDSYKYFIYPLPQNFDADQNGNYIFTRPNAEMRWLPIYIGQGDFGDQIGDQHHKAACLASKGATYVHVHLNATQQARREEEADLLANYAQAYAPVGCNEKVGG